MTPEDYQRFLEDRFRKANFLNRNKMDSILNPDMEARLREREKQLNPSRSPGARKEHPPVDGRFLEAPKHRRAHPPADGRFLNKPLSGNKSKPVDLSGLSSGPGVGRQIPKTGRFLDIPTAPQSGADKLGDIKAQLEALFNKPDIPGYWESPVSQDYLNQLSGQFNQAGTSAQQQLEAAKQEIINNYANTGAQRANENQAFSNELVGGLQNLGINTGDSAMLDRAQTDAAYLDQVAAQNQATDTSFNTKLGENAALLGQQLAMMAKEGLFHPKQWIPGQSGMSDGDRLRAQFLMDEYGNQRELESAVLDDGVTQEAEEEFVHQNPLFAEALGSIQDPGLREYIQNQYDLGGGNIQTALSNLAETKIPPENPEAYLLEEPDPTAAYNAELGRNVSGSLKGLMPSNAPENALKELIEKEYQEKIIGPWNIEQELARQATEFFRRLSPYYQGLITERNMTDSFKGQ